MSSYRSPEDWLIDWPPRAIAERVFAPSSIAPWTCPECDEPASVGLRVGEMINVRCARHGTWYAQAPFSFSKQELLHLPPRAFGMDPEARLWLLHKAAKAMLNAPVRAFLVVEVQGHPCEYAILHREPGYELGLQISGRQWDCQSCGNQPLSRAALDRLDVLGFAPAGHHLNAWCEDLPQQARGLAVLLERALVAAYERAPDFEVALYAATARDYVRLVNGLT